jgi:hypothetical protein
LSQTQDLRRGLPTTSRRRPSRREPTSWCGSGRALRGVSRIQRGRLPPAYRHFGSATSRTRRTDATTSPTSTEDSGRLGALTGLLTTEGCRNDARCTGCHGIRGTRAKRCHQHDSESRQTKPVRRPAHRFDDARPDVAVTGLQVWTGRISSLPSTSHSRTTAGTEAPVIGQFVAGGQQRSWLTSARFLRIAR